MFIEICGKLRGKEETFAVSLYGRAFKKIATYKGKSYTLFQNGGDQDGLGRVARKRGIEGHGTQDSTRGNLGCLPLW